MTKIKKFKITKKNTTVLSHRKVFAPKIFIFMTEHLYNLAFIKMGAKLGIRII